jgi:hypothetical protein
MTDKTKWDYVNNKVWADNVEWVEVKSRPFQHGSIGNTNAAKEETKSSVLTVRCYPHEKAKWVNAAKGQKLAEWVTDALNNEAEKRPQ